MSDYKGWPRFRSRFVCIEHTLRHFKVSRIQGWPGFVHIGTFQSVLIQGWPHFRGGFNLKLLLLLLMMMFTFCCRVSSDHPGPDRLSPHYGCGCGLSGVHDLSDLSLPQSHKTNRRRDAISARYTNLYKQATSV